MGKARDLTGQVFGRLTVVERGPNDKSGKARWYCKCSCGNEEMPLINGASLTRGLTKSCGCYKKEVHQKMIEEQLINEVGNVYGYLTVESLNTDPQYRDTEDKKMRAFWNCKCKCGNTYVAQGKLLRAGKITSCGCRFQSKGEEKIEEILLENDMNYAKEYFVKLPNSGRAYYDFAIFNNEQKLLYLIEFDGQQHDAEGKKENGQGWGNSLELYLKTHERDLKKNRWCFEHDIPLIRIPYARLELLCIEDLKLETTSFLLKPDMEEAEEVMVEVE